MRLNINNKCLKNAAMQINSTTWDIHVLRDPPPVISGITTHNSITTITFATNLVRDWIQWW